MSGLRLTDSQRLDWLRLSRTESIGPLTFIGLINRHGGAGQALAALPDLLKARGKSDIRIVTREAAEREVESAHKVGARFVAMGEPDYPPLLARIPAAPPLIAVLGRAEVFRHPYVAIVGSRNASGAGRSFTDKLARDLTAQGFGIVSGLARGIDTRAHEAALGFATVAVLAGGLDKPYPPENLRLMQSIAETGAVVSEMPFGWEPRGRDFPRRNRIISGIAYATVIIEAAKKSGSLITARFAREQNRELFAVPGSPLDPRAEGTNELLKEREVHFCTSAADIISEIAPILGLEREPELPLAGEEARPPRFRHAPLWEELDERWDLVPEAHFPGGFEEPPPVDERDEKPEGDARSRLLAALGPTPLEVDDLLRLARVSLREAQAVLLDLEMAGRLERHGGGRLSLLGAVDEA